MASRDGGRRPDGAVEQLLARHPPEVRELTERMHSLVRSTLGTLRSG